jgi:hypothetical protein
VNLNTILSIAATKHLQHYALQVQYLTDDEMNKLGRIDTLILISPTIRSSIFISFEALSIMMIIMLIVGLHLMYICKCFCLDGELSKRHRQSVKYRVSVT